MYVYVTHPLTRELPWLALVQVDLRDGAAAAEAAVHGLAEEVVGDQLLVRRVEAEPRRQLASSSADVQAQHAQPLHRPGPATTNKHNRTEHWSRTRRGTHALMQEQSQPKRRNGMEWKHQHGISVTQYLWPAGRGAIEW
jgi:hypothetical protein